MKCICGLTFKNIKSKYYKTHILKCDAYNNIEIYKFKTKCGKLFKKEIKFKRHNETCRFCKKQKRNEINKLLTKKFLQENLIKNKYSSNYIAKLLDNKYINAGTIILYAKKFGIKTYSIKEAANLKSVRRKYENTCIKKYGKINVLSKGTEKYEKKNKTVKKKYGVENVWQLKSTKDKSKITMIEKYGVEHSIYLPYRRNNNGRKSKPHKIIENILDSLKINYISDEFTNKFLKYNNVLEREYSPRPDLIIEDRKIIIEIYGDYWHANKKIYNENDIIAKWTGNECAKDIWIFDKARTDQLKSFGYKVYILYESFILKNKEKLKEVLCKMLKLNQ